MNSTKMLLAAAAFAALALAAVPAGAQIHVGSIGGSGGPGLGSGFNPSPGGPPPNVSGGLGQFPMSAMSEEGDGKAHLGYPDLRLTGRVGVDPSKVPQGAQVVQLRLDGELYPMVVDSSSLSSSGGGDLEQHGYIATKEMYRAALEKQLTLVGNPDLRSRIANSSASHQQMEVEGYVFNRVSPYFVVRSVTLAQAK